MVAGSRLAAVALGCVVASAVAEVYFQENFDEFDEEKWIESTHKKNTIGPWYHTPGEWYADGEFAKGIQTTSDHKHHIISAKMPKPFSNDGKTLVVQFSVKHELKEYQFCGGGYIKLHGSGLNQLDYNGNDAYNIMFGPDLCGYDISRIHCIFRDHLGENHLREEDIKLDYDDKDEYTHLYTLILFPDRTYKVLFDTKEKASGSLPEDWNFQPESHDDPTDTKPADWVDEAEMDDPEDSKPDGWDDVPERIPDETKDMPDDWDEEIDGEWEPPTVDNPEYKGKWKPAKIPNPGYKGPFVPKQLANQHYHDEIGIYHDNAYVGFELWTVNHGSIFDNILITDDVELAANEAEKLKETWEGEKQAKKNWIKRKNAAPVEEDEEEEVEEEPPHTEL